jgi:hypothetical protein
MTSLNFSLSAVSGISYDFLSELFGGTKFFGFGIVVLRSH